jgi:hypothetical protein
MSDEHIARLERERNAARAALRSFLQVAPLPTEPDGATHKISVTARELRAGFAALRSEERKKKPGVLGRPPGSSTPRLDPT